MNQTESAVASGNLGAAGGEERQPSPGATARVQLDSLVRGKVGYTDNVREMRVYRTTSFGWVAGIETGTGAQSIMYEFDVIAPPRPVRERRDIPDRLTR